MGTLLFGRKVPTIAWFGAIGGALPDVPMFAITGYLRATGHQFEQIFGVLYWEHWWQIANAIGHNFILWGTVCALSYAACQSGNVAIRFRGTCALAFSNSALLHSLIDLVSHRTDGHMHFWPLTQWRFVSPVSYWDSAHYGIQFSLLEAAIGMIIAILLFRTFKQWAVRTLLALAAVLYGAMPAFFILNMNH